MNINIGDYTLYRKGGFDTIYNAYCKEEFIGEVQLSQDGILYWVRTLDDDLITLLLLMYQASANIKIEFDQTPIHDYYQNRYGYHW